MIKQKIKILLTVFFVFFLFNQKILASDFNHYIDSDWGDGYCYHFKLSNNTENTIYDWLINFKINGNTNITSIWGGSYIKNGINYKIRGLDRNSNLQIGDNNIEVGFCANGKKRPEDVKFNIGDNLELENISCNWPNKNSCEGGSNKNSCFWSEDKCNSINDNEEEIEENNGNEENEIENNLCRNTETISDINLVQNYSFEDYYEWNIKKTWILKIIGHFLKFIGLVEDLPEWSSLNNDFKLWVNSEIQASEQENFLEINDINSIFQNIDTSNNKKYLLSFDNIGADELEVKWNNDIIHKQYGTNLWQTYTYEIDGKNSNSKLEFKNSKQNSNSFGIPIASNENNCNNFKNESSCTSGNRQNICIWEDDICKIKNSNENNILNCSRNNSSNNINLNANKITLENKNNKLVCSEWINGNKIISQEGNDYFELKRGEDFLIDMGNGNNIFKHKIYNNKLENITIKGGENFDILIIEDEYESNFNISGNCNINCNISLNNNFWTLWRGWRFKNIRLENIENIKFRNSEINYSETSSQEYIFETSLRLGLDNIKIREIIITENEKKDLYGYIDESLIRYVEDNSCSQLFYDLENPLKDELLNILLTNGDYNNLAIEFFNGLEYLTKYNVIQNNTFTYLKNYINECYSEQEKKDFYDYIYNLTHDNIGQCVINNIDINIEKKVSKLNYLKNSGGTCSIEENKIFLKYNGNYSIYK